MRSDEIDCRSEDGLCGVTWSRTKMIEMRSPLWSGAGIELTFSACAEILPPVATTLIGTARPFSDERALCFCRFRHVTMAGCAGQTLRPARGLLTLDRENVDAQDLYCNCLQYGERADELADSSGTFTCCMNGDLMVIAGESMAESKLLPGVVQVGCEG